jgi:hypothetical protein
VPPDARPSLQAQTPRAKETPPPKLVLRKRWNEVPETAEERFVLNFVIDRRAARRVARTRVGARQLLVSPARLHSLTRCWIAQQAKALEHGGCEV